MTSVTLANVPQLRPDQARIARALDEYDVVVGAMGRRYGKTVIGLVLVLAALLHGMRVAWIVPTYKNSNPLWRALCSALGPLITARRVRINQSARMVELYNRGFLAIYSADNADAVRGEWFHLVILDEAARIAEEIVADVVTPLVADVGGKIVNLSTPRGRNWFWREFERGVTRSDNVIAFRAPSSDNPNPRIKRAAELARLKFGEDSSTYRQEWCAEFVEGLVSAWLRSWADERYDPDDPALEASAVARILSYDTALKDKVENAYTACVVADLLPDYRLLIRHVWRERLLFPDLVSALHRDITLHNTDQKLWAVLIEDAASGAPAYQTLTRSGDDALRSKLYAITPRGSKEARFETAGVWVKHRRVVLPRPSPSVRWLHAYEEELFTETEYADQRDATSQVINWLQEYLATGLPKPADPSLRSRAGVA